MLTVFSEPQLRAPVVLCGVAGWSDAASAASSALRYLLARRKSERLAEFDADHLYVYTITRPMVEFAAGHQRVLRWPSFAFQAIRVPEAAHDLVLLTGPEPDLHWPAVARAAADYARRLGAVQLITLGCFFAPVHYARPPIIIGGSTVPAQEHQLRAIGAQESSYQGPTGFLSALVAEMSAREIATASLWTAAPSYLPNVDNPKLAAALLGVVERLLGQDLWRRELEAAGWDLDQRIREAMRQRPDLAKDLDQLEHGDAESQEETPPPASAGDLPTKEDVLREVEEHLRRLRGQQPDDPRG